MNLPEFSIHRPVTILMACLIAVLLGTIAFVQIPVDLMPEMEYPTISVTTREMKLPGPVIDGQMYGALFAKQAMDWLGPMAFIRRLEFRMAAMAFAGDTLAGEGEVVETGADDGHGLVVLAQRLRNGERLIAEATTELQASLLQRRARSRGVVANLGPHSARAARWTHTRSAWHARAAARTQTR